MYTFHSNSNTSYKTLEFMFMKHYAPNRCEPSIEVIMNMGGGVIFFLGGGGGGLGGQGGCKYGPRHEKTNIMHMGEQRREADQHLCFR